MCCTARSIHPACFAYMRLAQERLVSFRCISTSARLLPCRRSVCANVSTPAKYLQDPWCQVGCTLHHEVLLSGSLYDVRLSRVDQNPNALTTPHLVHSKGKMSRASTPVTQCSRACPDTHLSFSMKVTIARRGGISLMSAR
jgi:hypothetical protein